MLLILISWCYIFITLVNFGFVATKILQFPLQNKLLHLVLGLSIILITSHIWAFFEGFGIVFHIFLLLSNVFIASVFKLELIQFFKEIQRTLFHFSRTYQILLLVILLLFLAKSASMGSFIDNENYYVQTIKWLNQYGFVKGLANFNLLLGQTSGWHVLQSAFSFHFLNIDFNDIGGFFLFILNVYAFKLAYRKSQSIQLLIWLPALNWFILEFCTVPSPDFGIILFGIILVSLFLKTYKNPTKTDAYISFILFLSAILIKVTAIGLFIFPMVLLFKLEKKSLFFYLKNTGLLFLFALLWIGKNLVISGHPFYPSNLLSNFFELTHQVPDALYNFSLRKDKLFEFFATTKEVKSLSILALFWRWLTYSKVSMFFNISLMLSIFVIPFLITRLKSKAKFWWVYASFVFQLIFLVFTSPQYRFAIHYLIIFCVLFLNINKIASKYRISIFALSQILVLYFILFPIQFSQLSSKNYTLKSSSFQLENVVIPISNSSIQTTYKTNTIGNLKYYSAVDTFYLWVSGDGDLPCINDTQLLFTAQKTRFVPQLIDSLNLSKGFFAKKIPISN